MDEILAKLLPWLGCLAIGGIGGGYLVHKLDAGAKEKVQVNFDQFKASVASRDDLAQAAAEKAVQAQMAQLQSVLGNNADVMGKLDAANNALASVHDLSQRLLNATNAASAASAAGDPVSKGNGGPLADNSISPAGLQRLTELCAAVADEDAENANQLDALSQELRPQLQPASEGSSASGAKPGSSQSP